MRVTETALAGVLLVEPRVFRDARGHFLETWSQGRYAEAGIAGPFVQDNVSVSRRGVVRGLHYQHPHAQGKLVSVLRGEAFDVAVDIRAGSPTFGKWVGARLSGEDGRQLWIPPGFAHGFAALSEETVFSYRCTELYHPEAEGTVLWSDPALAIPWPVSEPLLAEKDRAALPLSEIAPERLPRWEGAA